VFWKVPAPYGYGSSVDGAGTVAAPLLAGFNITLIGLLIGLPVEAAVPLRDLAVVVLVVSILLLLACVQCSVWAREYTVTPAQITEWWPDLADPGPAGDARRNDVRAEQWSYRLLANCWGSRARYTYHYGILSLLAGIALLLVPAYFLSWRTLAVAIAAVGFLAELYWTIAPGKRGWPKVPELFPQPRDVHTLEAAQPTPYTGPLPKA
jgi:hypothetical protein